MKYLLILSALSGIFSLGHIKLNTEKSMITITGTSSLHDWEMSVDEFDVTGMITDTQVQNLEVSITAKSMNSGKSVMDKKAFDAVREEDYPRIKFVAKTLDINGDYISGKGSIEIGGESRAIDLNAKIISNGTSEMQLQGQVPLKMSDFNIKPPTAMFGTLKTGNDVVINYDILISK